MARTITYFDPVRFIVPDSAVTTSSAGVVVDLTETAPGALQKDQNLGDLESAATARGNLGGTATGVALFTAANAGAARTAIGATTLGANIMTAADAAAVYTALGLGDYADDAAAATGGVAVGRAYHTAGVLRTRMA